MRMAAGNSGNYGNGLVGRGLPSLPRGARAGNRGNGDGNGAFPAGVAYCCR